ncbi:MAG: NUDIX hydrolase [Microbacterium ginsengisoli]|jgi:8-oxo-(d)GTP phosphatase|uniref:NUDIX hydrolase n=2 Tax=Microbacteriaceae TaxID=85023 RepID=UPI0006F87A68|nr:MULTISPECIES: NUDIX hydrolase [unclassified Microbacterium]KQR96945.1 DNA mismatch repair protein MutT [Microbacterium sp. Leaf347]MBN9198095.1 NUDIX hydrolase [Microbacterium ginsengisoli]ODU79523.1 MAG: DNA mismatch repair protein MutT [Microbacterium sp. SCN 71-21]OJU78512.1 MAG: DNA mismatch repair protein MutT [Microbacterium sp. 71-23]
MTTTVYAAGGVVWRLVEGRLHILLIHRTQYRDVTLPKGKLDPGESLLETAVREIFEETGIKVALGVPVGVSRYHLPSRREKVVHYWAAEATDAAIRASAFVPNKEIAALEWVTPKRALGYLSYPVDVEIVTKFLDFVDRGVLQTFPVIALRHAKAVARESWKGEDADRPLTDRGARQAEALVGPLRSFGVRRIVSSPAVRCLATVAPLAAALERDVRTTPLISQDLWEEGRSDARTVIGKRVRSRKPAVLCSHGPVLPDILAELALATGTLRGAYLGSASALPVGGFSVVHLSATNPGAGIAAIETHTPAL